MEDCHTLTFNEPDSNEEVCVIVRTINGLVELTLSRKLDGDVSVLLPPNQTRELIKHLQDSTQQAR